MIDTKDRKDINIALAKAIAFSNCGRKDDAEKWARELINLLQLKQILK